MLTTGEFCRGTGEDFVEINGETGLLLRYTKCSHSDETHLVLRLGMYVGQADKDAPAGNTVHLRHFVL